MSVLKKSDFARARIEELSKKGNGVGQLLHDQEPLPPVEVPFAIPGDLVNVKIRKRRKGKYLAILDGIETPSKLRITPRCKHFSVCGGCRLQNLSYLDQLDFKEKHIRKCFGTLIHEKVDFRPIIPCNPKWRYRNKMEFTFSSDKSGNRYLGLIMDSSRGKVMNLTECHLVNPWFMGVLSSVRNWWEESGLTAYHLPSDRGSLRTLIVREGKRTGDRLVMITVSGNPEFSLNKQQLEEFVRVVREEVEQSGADNHLSIVLRIHQVAKGMPTNFYEMVLFGPDHIRENLRVRVDPADDPLEMQFHISPTAFFQPNTLQTERLYSEALQIAAVSKGAVVYDLYCGTGIMGICAANYVKDVIGIEVSQESTLNARKNASLNGIMNIKIISGAVRYILPQIIEDTSIPKPDIVIVDPPRPGLDPKAIDGLLSLNSPKILYISCNPETQAENLIEIVSKGYQIEVVQPIDQFAQTPHVENIVLLVKNS